MIDNRQPRRPVFLLGLGALLMIALLALGTWQVQRRAWKLDLIARVEARVHARPSPLSVIGTDLRGEEYRRVAVTGRFVAGPPTLVQALTERGAGYWTMVPFRMRDGPLVLVNRGFVPGDRVAEVKNEPRGETTIVGLLRLSEPGGGFLRRNDPVADRWFSRDVAVIGNKRKLAMAPYFIDADATPNPGGLPIGGLTVIRFPNNHLIYATTWYALAAMVAGAMVMLWRGGKRGSVRPAG